MLNSDIDMIEEQNKNIEGEIKNHEQLGDMTEKEKVQCRERLKREIEESQAQMKEKETQIKNIEYQMAETKQYVQQMCEAFKKSHFFLSVAQNAQYDDDTTFNENNVVLYLSELEEYISLFITYLAYKQANPDAAISSLSLEKMAVKEFNKEGLKIEEPNSQDTFLMNDEAETEDEITTNPKQLYKRFEEMIARGDGSFLEKGSAGAS